MAKVTLTTTETKTVEKEIEFPMFFIEKSNHGGWEDAIALFDVDDVRKVLIIGEREQIITGSIDNMESHIKDALTGKNSKQTDLETFTEIYEKAIKVIASPFPVQPTDDFTSNLLTVMQ